MGQEKSWRLGLRAYLAEVLKAGELSTVGDLVERFGDQIPLHHASRKWALNHRDKTNLNYPTAYKMRFYTLTQELHWLGCTFDPPGLKSYQTTVFPHGHRCPRCGEMYIAKNKVLTHGTLCRAWKAAS